MAAELERMAVQITCLAADIANMAAHSMLAAVQALRNFTVTQIVQGASQHLPLGACELAPELLAEVILS